MNLWTSPANSNASYRLIRQALRRALLTRCKNSVRVIWTTPHLEGVPTRRLNRMADNFAGAGKKPSLSTPALTSEQLDTLRHMLGINTPHDRQPKPYRDYYCAN